MNKRSNFYPNGEIIDFRLPQDFRPSSGRGSCGNCGQLFHGQGESKRPPFKTENAVWAGGNKMLLNAAMFL